MFWDLIKYKLIETINMPYQCDKISIQLNDGNLFVGGNYKFCLIDIIAKQIVFTYEDNDLKYIHSLFQWDDDTILCGGKNGNLYTVTLSMPKLIKINEMHNSYLYGICRKDDKLITCSDDWKILVWRLKKI